MYYLCSVDERDNSTVLSPKPLNTLVMDSVFTFVNCTPHAIKLNDGTTYEPSGMLPRVSTHYGEVISGISITKQGEVEGLPEPKQGVFYIVSAMVLANSNRTDLVAPATGHKDCVRTEKGHIVSVPFFIR